MAFSRRDFIGASVAGLASATSVANMAFAADNTGSAPQIAGSEDEYWARIAADYNREEGVINLEHGYWTKLAGPVQKKYVEHQEYVNRRNSLYARQDWKDDLAQVQERLAEQLQCKPSEIALTRNASEALQALIGGYRSLSKGDAVLVSDLDYPSVMTGFDTLAARHDASVIKINLPEPATYENVIEAYDKAMDANPKIRLLLLTHVSNRTGLVVPVREIVERAKARNVDVIVDTAHSWGQLDFTVDDLGADFIGFNLHKWVGAPLGVGFVYIRESRLDTIAPDMSSSESNTDETAGRVYVGTINFAAVRAVIDALDYCNEVGWQNKEKRFRALRDVWATEARKLPKVQVLTPDDPRLYTGLTSFRLKDQTSDEANEALAKRLLDDHGIFTVYRSGVAKGSCIRVTPGLENTEEDCARLLDAIRTIAA